MVFEVNSWPEFCQVVKREANKMYSRLDIISCRSYDCVKTEILRGFRLRPKAYLQKFRTMKRYGDASYSLQTPNHQKI